MSKIQFLSDNISDEDYLIATARKYKENDPWSAKSWMITAKTLFPQTFSVQYEAYNMAYEAGNIPEASKCLEGLIGAQNFSEEPALWAEMKKITESLKSESKDLQRYRDLFHKLSTEVQHGMIVTVADHSEDTMEHCQLMLLLLNMFPQKIGNHGVKLIETLFSAEKHGHYQSPVNGYRQLLVTEVLPLILKSQEASIPPKLIFRLLQKSIEFYVGFAFQTNLKNKPQTPTDNVMGLQGPVGKPSISFDSPNTDTWPKLFSLMASAAQLLNWELGDVFSANLSDDARWQRIATFVQQKGVQVPASTPFEPNTDDSMSSNNRQIFFCTVLVFLHSLYNFAKSLNPEWFSGVTQSSITTQFILVERPPELIITDINPNEMPKHKKRKSDPEVKDDILNTSLTVSLDTPPDISAILTQSFMVAARCWLLIQSHNSLKKEFKSLSQHLQMDNWPWFQEFFIDSQVFQGLHQDAVHTVLKYQKKDEPLHSKMKQNLQLASSFWCMGNIARACDCFLDVICSFAEDTTFLNTKYINSNASLLNKLHKKSGRNLHFLKLSSLDILDYCITMITICFKKRALNTLGLKDDFVLGHLIVLTQYCWPIQEDDFLQLIEIIKAQQTFSYRLFYNYIINPDFLEEFMFLTTSTGGNVTLNLVAMPSQSVKQRAVTRGINRGAKEDLKMSMEKQMCRCEDSLEQLLVTFFKQERELLQQYLC